MSLSYRPLAPLAPLALAMVTGLAAPAWADETDPPGDLTVSASAALVSDYRFRGLSRSAGDVAVQGGVAVDHVSGFYAGLWASSLSHGRGRQFSDPVHGDIQLDAYAGWRGALRDGWIADFGLLRSSFPAGHFGHADYFEPYAALSTTLGPATARIGVNYAWKQAALNFDGGGKDDNVYVHLDLDSGIPGTAFAVSGGLGYTEGALSPKFAGGETADYAGGFDWNLGVSYTIAPHLSIGARYVGVAGRGIDAYSNDTLVGSLKLAF
jgi:uncharacterized protein (TIGR02001 family)